MTMLAPKRPTEVKRYLLDYSRELGGDPIEAYQLVVTSGAVTVNSDKQEGPFAICALLGGGVDGQTSALELQITTESGQLLIRDMSILTAAASNATGGLPSSTTKGQVMNMAFEEIGLPGYEFDATSSEQASALQRLDSLMAMLASSGENLDVGYNFPTSVGGSSMTDISGIPDLALDFVVGRLAISIAPGIGKTLSVETRARMAMSLRAIRATLAVIPRVCLPGTTARGAGAKPWSTWRPFGGSRREAMLRPGLGALWTEDGDPIGTENGDEIGG